MTTLEKLLVQLFNWKDSIIEQLQQHADSYTQQLASRLVIDGITPPPWLLSPRSSNPNGLEKEDIISKLLLRPPRNSTRYSTGGRSLYHPPVIAKGNINKHLSTEKCIETHALVCHDHDIAGSLDHAPVVYDSAKSPQNDTDAIITSTYAEPNMSLAIIQKSKSWQKARELRSSGKATAISCSSDENRIHLSCSGDLNSRKDFSQFSQELDGGIMVKPTGDSLQQY
ncbi:uncharacterized protein LOC143628134 [Bidens hawaiensis]|uniref:uncharacterized protein LOC143628134 n=1 Tax=Bidens hawaiensis TaxID=980011 RepID=UPI004049857F